MGFKTNLLSIENVWYEMMMTIDTLFYCFIWSIVKRFTVKKSTDLCDDYLFDGSAMMALQFRIMRIFITKHKEPQRPKQEKPDETPNYIGQPDLLNRLRSRISVTNRTVLPLLVLSRWLYLYHDRVVQVLLVGRNWHLLLLERNRLETIVCWRRRWRRLVVVSWGRTVFDCVLDLHFWSSKFYWG